MVEKVAFPATFSFLKPCWHLSSDTWHLALAMAALAGLGNSLLNREEAEVRFQPWWDAAEDAVLAALLSIGRNKGSAEILLSGPLSRARHSMEDSISSQS